MNQLLEGKGCFGNPRKEECKKCMLVRECLTEVKLRMLGVKPSRIGDGKVL